MKNNVLWALIVILAVTPFVFGQNTLSSVEQLQQLTRQLQQSPSDQALRERIIALTLTLNPKPATPDAATMAEGAAEYAFKNAKTTSDYSKAAIQYEKALLLAPWLADDYFNCGVAYEKANESNEAIRNFNLYQLAAPNAADAQTIKKRIGGLQYAAQEAVQEANSPEAIWARLLKSLDGGVWRVTHDYGTNYDGSRYADSDALGLCYLAVKGNTIAYNYYIVNADGSPGVKTHVRHYNHDPNIPPQWTTVLTGNTFSGPKLEPLAAGSYTHFTITDNGRIITEEARYIYPGGAATSTSIFERIK